MTRRSPKPHNFDAMTSAWDNPAEFARELNAHYAQLRESGDLPRESLFEVSG